MAKRRERGDRFTSEVIVGHGGVRAFLVPFDPGVIWGSELVRWTHPLFDGQKRKGYPARIRIKRYEVDTFIGYRWKRFFVLVDEPMIAALGIDTGDPVNVEAWPREPAARPSRRR